VKKKVCLLCGSSILEESRTDPNICKDCEEEVARIRYLKDFYTGS
jgi:hypothetical protein